MPHSPSGSGCMAPPMSPWPSLMMSMNSPTVEAQHHGPPHIRVVEGRRIAVDDQVAADPAWRHLADRAGLLALDVLGQRQSCRDPIELPGDESEVCRRA